MDKRKLIQIITKDLEELKFLTEEVTDIEGDATLIIDLAHSKARLLCQEIELLRELSVPAKKLQEEDEEDLVDEEETEIDDREYNEPELEILNFEESNESEEENIPDEIEEEEEEEEEPAEAEGPEIENEEEELVTEENQETELEEKDEILEHTPTEEEPDQTEEDLVEEEEESTKEEEENEVSEGEEEANEEEEEEEIVYEDDEEEEDYLTEEEAEEEVEKDEEGPIQQKNIQFTELDSEAKPEYREINIDDPDDDDIETIQFSPHKSTSDRPVMVEIPKPENQNLEKAVIGETFQKERSLNDAMGENKSSESKLTNGPISSLRAAIGLNDRFLFIREIFDNNTEKYNTVIDNLDKLETIQQAVEYLKANLSLQKNDTSMKFVDLLKRRFSK